MSRNLQLSKKVHRAAALAFLFTLTGCSLSPVDLPNPLADENGIKVNAQVGKNNTLIEKKQLAEVTTSVDASDKSVNTTSNVADTIKIVNEGADGYLVFLLCFFAGIAIPTRGQHNMIKQLRENLEYERARTDVTIQAHSTAGTRGPIA